MIVGRSCWLLVHPDGRVKWSSLDFREDRPRVPFWLPKWRWQRWGLESDRSDYPFISQDQNSTDKGK